MEILVKATQLILSLSILVILHEFGHFFFAKLFKTRVEKFYLFFNPWFSLFKFKKGDTEYGIGWLPLGGYVKISGMIDESMDKEQMKQPAQDFEFRAKPAWQRLLIMIGGVLVNVLLAFVIYIFVLFAWGEEYLPNANAKYGIMVTETAKEIGFENGDKIISIDGNKVEKFRSINHDIVVEDAKIVKVNRNGEIIDITISPESIGKIIKDPRFISVRFPFVISSVGSKTAKEAGLLADDKVIAFNGDKVEFYDEVREKLQENKNEDAEIIVLRNNKEINLTVPISENGTIGVGMQSLDKFFEYKITKFSFFEAIPAGINKAFSTIDSYIKQLKLLFNKEAKAYESLGGFITIGNIFPGVWDWHAFWNLTAFLSIILAVMNILPIPALDGGHVMFLLYEIITGREPNEKFMEYAQIGGMALLIGLLLFANGNDIFKMFN